MNPDETRNSFSSHTVRLPSIALLLPSVALISDIRLFKVMRILILSNHGCSSEGGFIKASLFGPIRNAAAGSGGGNHYYY